MSPDATGAAAALARLLAEIDADREALDQRLDDAREGDRRLAATPEDPGALALLLAFRHFYRHAYAVTLDADRLRSELARLFSVAAAVEAGLDGLVGFLREAMANLTPS